MQITICPVCGHRIRWEPALDGEPKCGHCGWEPDVDELCDNYALMNEPEYEAEMKGGEEDE